MPDVYGNPYLPPFVRNQPKMADPVPSIQTPILPTKVSQIVTVQGFDGARQHASTLTNGSSELVAESDPNVSRVYAIVVDQNGQRYVQGFRLVPEEEPKKVTMDDLNDKMNVVLERLGRLESERGVVNDKPDLGNAQQSKPVSSTDRFIASVKQPNGDDQSDGYD